MRSGSIRKAQAADRSAVPQDRPRVFRTASKPVSGVSLLRAKSQKAAPQPGALRSALRINSLMSRTRSSGSCVIDSMAASRRRTSSVPKPDSTDAGDSFRSVGLESATLDSWVAEPEFAPSIRLDWNRTDTTDVTSTTARSPTVHRALRAFDARAPAVAPSDRLGTEYREGTLFGIMNRSVATRRSPSRAVSDYPQTQENKKWVKNGLREPFPN